MSRIIFTLITYDNSLNPDNNNNNNNNKFIKSRLQKVRPSSFQVGHDSKLINLRTLSKLHGQSIGEESEKEVAGENQQSNQISSEVGTEKVKKSLSLNTPVTSSVVLSPNKKTLDDDTEEKEKEKEKEVESGANTADTPTAAETTIGATETTETPSTQDSAVTETTETQAAV